MTFSLTGKQRRFLRALGHTLRPVVQIGHAGLTEPVLKAIDRALTTHELIKVKVATEASEGAETLVEPIEQGAGSTVAQVLGHTLLVYRGRKRKPGIVLPDDQQPGSVNADTKAAKAPAPGRHLAKKRGRGKKHSVSPRTEANRRSEASRREGRSRGSTRERGRGSV